jgi:hypothetical protein
MASAGSKCTVLVWNPYLFIVNKHILMYMVELQQMG